MFPSQIESVLVGTKGISDKIGPHYQLVVRRKNYMDNLEVKVELIDASLLSSFRELEVLQRAIHDRLKSVLASRRRSRWRSREPRALPGQGQARSGPAQYGGLIRRPQCPAPGRAAAATAFVPPHGGTA